jgi:hypothetical protein
MQYKHIKSKCNIKYLVLKSNYIMATILKRMALQPEQAEVVLLYIYKPGQNSSPQAIDKPIQPMTTAG